MRGAAGRHIPSSAGHARPVWLRVIAPSIETSFSGRYQVWIQFIIPKRAKVATCRSAGSRSGATCIHARPYGTHVLPLPRGDLAAGAAAGARITLPGSGKNRGYLGKNLFGRAFERKATRGSEEGQSDPEPDVADA